MRWIQDSGEKPTGAFPSSHVGLTIITMSILFKNTKKFFFIILPVAIILVTSTVYIKAHYLIDVIAAFIVAPIIFITSKQIFKLFERITNKLNH
jgi:membrane-associated phospholipid phosphatase